MELGEGSEQGQAAVPETTTATGTRTITKLRLVEGTHILTSYRDCDHRCLRLGKGHEAVNRLMTFSLSLSLCSVVIIVVHVVLDAVLFKTDGCGTLFDPPTDPSIDPSIVFVVVDGDAVRMFRTDGCTTLPIIPSTLRSILSL